MLLKETDYALPMALISDEPFVYQTIAPIVPDRFLAYLTRTALFVYNYKQMSVRISAPMPLKNPLPIVNGDLACLLKVPNHGRDSSVLGDVSVCLLGVFKLFRIDGQN